jgi:hypothetical protein
MDPCDPDFARRLSDDLDEQFIAARKNRKSLDFPGLSKWAIQASNSLQKAGILKGFLKATRNPTREMPMFGGWLGF